MQTQHAGPCAGLDFRQLHSVEEARTAALEALQSKAGVPDDHVALQEIPRSPTVGRCTAKPVTWSRHAEAPDAPWLHALGRSRGEDEGCASMQSQ